jgi:putative membrane protein
MRMAMGLFSVACLAAVWLGPLPALAAQSFAAHMAMHMGVVAVAAPCIALALADTRLDPFSDGRWLSAPIAASFVELIVVWGWHAPVMHESARHHSLVLVAEQASFAAAGVFLWLTALGGSGAHRRTRAAIGVTALLLTSMHMTLLGALLALANRPLFGHAGGIGADALADQQLGGAIMLIIGGASYLGGGLWLSVRIVRTRPVDTVPRRESLS